MSERPETPSPTLLDLYFYPQLHTFITSSWTKLLTPIALVLLIFFEGFPLRNFLILASLILMGIMWLFGKLKPATQDNSGQSAPSRSSMSSVGHHPTIQRKLSGLRISDQSRLRNAEEEQLHNEDGSSTAEFLSPQRSFSKEPLDTGTWSSVTSPGFTSRVVRLSNSTPLRDFNSQMSNQSPFDVSPHRHLGLGEIPYPSWKKTPRHESPLAISGVNRSPLRPYSYLTGSAKMKYRGDEEFTAYLKIAPVPPTNMPSSPQQINSGFNFSGSEGNKSVGLGGTPQAALNRGFSPRLMSSHNYSEKQIKVPTSQTSSTPNNIIDALNNRKRSRGSEASTSSSNAIARNVLSSGIDESPKSSKRTKFYPTIPHHEDREMSNRSISNMPIQSSSHSEEPMSSESILEQMNQTEKRFLPDDGDESHVVTRTAKRSKGTSGTPISTKTTTNTLGNSYRKRRSQGIGVVELEPKEKPPRLCSCNECCAEAAGSVLDMSTSPIPSPQPSRVPSPIKIVSKNISFSDKSIETEKGPNSSTHPDKYDILLTDRKIVDVKSYFEDKERRILRLNRLLGLANRIDPEKTISTPPPSSSSSSITLNHKGMDMVDGPKNGFSLNQTPSSSSNGINILSPLTTASSGGFSFGSGVKTSETTTVAAPVSVPSTDSGISKGGFNFGVLATDGSGTTQQPETPSDTPSKESNLPPPPYTSTPISSTSPPAQSTPILTVNSSESSGFSFGAPSLEKDTASSTTTSAPAINLPAFGFAAAGPSTSASSNQSTPFTFGVGSSPPASTTTSEISPATTTTDAANVPVPAASAANTPFASSSIVSPPGIFNINTTSTSPASSSQPLFTHTALTTTTSVFSQPITSSSITPTIKNTDVSIPNLFGTPASASVVSGLSGQAMTSSIASPPGVLTSSIFGASTATPLTTTTAAAPSSVFAFGQTKDSSAPSPFGVSSSGSVPIFGSTTSGPASGGFAFRGSSTAVTTTTNSTPGFSFGESKDKGGTSGVGGFAFGNPATPVINKTEPSGGFAFGGGSTGIVSQPAPSPFSAFSSPSPSNPSGGFSFGSTAQANATPSNVFGTPTTTTSSSSGSGFSFGKKEGGIFGAPTPTTSTFTTPNNTMSNFGGSNTPASTGFGQGAPAFGQPANQPQQQQSSSVFGQSMTTATPIFGSQPAAASPFGSSLSSFGAAKAPTTTPAPSPFGQPAGNTGFGQSAFTASAGTLGQQSAPNLFGQSSTVQTSAFGTPVSTPAPTFNFGAAASTPAAAPPPAFGTPTGGFNFGGAATQPAASPSAPFNFAATANPSPTPGLFQFGQQQSSPAGFNFGAQAQAQGFSQPGQPQPPQMFNLGTANTTPSYGRRRETRARRFR